MPETIEINSILKDFHKISGVRISIHDTEFNEIYSYPKEMTPFCKQLQKNLTVLNDCKQNDRAAFEKVKNTGEVYVYKCRRGLYEAVAPIYHFETLSGYIMMGQICDNNPVSMQNVYKKTIEILKDKKVAEEICSTIHIIDKNLIDSYINIMIVLAKYLTSSNRLSEYNKRLPQLIKDYLNKNLASKIKLSDLSQKFGCCNATLTNSFKNEFGISIMTYLCDLRIKKAAEMITNTRKTFKEISNECGFYDQNYFSKTFTKYHGLSPTQFRTQKNN